MSMMWWTKTPAATLLLQRAGNATRHHAPVSSACVWRPLQAAPVPSPLRVGPASSTTFVRTLRGGRAQRRRAAQLAEEYEMLLEMRRQQKQERKAARPPPPLPAVPSYIRIRELAKLLKKPVEEVLKKVVTRKDRRLHMTLGGDRFEFKNIKQVILPFQSAEEVAKAFGVEIAYDDVEPTLLMWPQRTGTDETPKHGVLPEHVMERNPVIAVMGHVDHGKTTLMDTLRNSSIAKSEKHGITQKINICEADLSPSLRATFLDMPGHFHFFRMRNNAAQVADMVLLIVAADEGCLLQTEESVGAIEGSNIPVIACINKTDIASPSQLDAVREEIRSFVALQTCPIVEISAKTGDNLDELKDQISQLLDLQPIQRKLEAYVGPDVPGQGLVLESIVVKGRGTVLRVLLKNGVLKKQDHFVAGMIHGVVRSVKNADSGKELEHAVPGMIVDVSFANKSKNVDAPIEFGFFVLPEARARQVMEQRQLALDFAENAIPLDDDEEYEDGSASPSDAEIVEDSAEDESAGDDLDADRPIKSIIVKADGAGSLTSIQDTVDELQGVSTVRIGIGHVTAHDIDVAINRSCPIFGFNVKLRKREATLAAKRGVRVVLRSTIHGLIEEIEQFTGSNQATPKEE